MKRNLPSLLGSAAILLATLPIAACRQQPPTNGLTPVKLQTDWYPQPEQGGFYTALVKGYYKDAGLDVQILPGGPYTSVEQQVSTGQAQFAMGSSDRLLEADATGQALIAVAATMQHDPQAIMVHADSPVHSFADLNGHSLAARAGATWFEYIVSRYHLDIKEIPATYSVANFLADPNYIQQIFITSEPFYARKAGVPVRTLLISDSGYDPYRVFFTTRAYAGAHPEVVRKFVAASLRGWAEYLRDPSAAHALIRQLNPAMDPALMEYSYQALRDGHFVDGAPGTVPGSFDPARLQAMQQLLLNLKVISKPVDPSTAYSNQFLPR
jgi:NitT/TauT family transport system substrate-binding protein